jgi:hypothetical protein
MEETFGGSTGIDYPGLFRGIEGFETPSDPEGFLKDVNNWIPLTILRDLLSRCERISGRMDFAYHAARAYFDPVKKDVLSPFKIIFQVLNDVRSVFICSHLWAAVQTNYLKLQSFETPGPRPGLHMLARFADNARPGADGTQFLRGFSEGFPRLYSFIEEVQCLEEISQVRIEDILRGFSGFTTTSEGDHLSIHQRSS